MPEDEAKSSPKEEKILVSWLAPVRPFKRRSRDFYIKLLSVSFLIGLILYLIEGFMPVFLLIAIIFFVYVLSTVEPEKINYAITESGLKLGSEKILWEALGRFWFTKRLGSELLVLEALSLTGRLEIVITAELKEKIKEALVKHLNFEKVSPSQFDKAAGWIDSKLLS